MDSQPTFSPPPVPAKVLLSFGEAMQQLAQGKKITRVEWDNADYGFLRDGLVGIFRNGTEYKFWNINDGDILANDWVVLEEN